ncbi:lactose-binding lectin l-2 isoform X2 [Chanos chanos]|uniref:Lactose-binding lectin l-2 isoform X2 n=1 Tax=Chanos chanos TaxID=29144 RepID=A0A6J2V707_CHACN|nr:lactose-binding lectin l-2-like isoform X2 [Chanos chanos]
MMFLSRLRFLGVFFLASLAFADEVILDTVNETELERSVQSRTLCPWTWVYSDGRCFKYTATKMDWAAAELNCVSMGANLPSVHSENEYQFLKTLVRTYDPAENPTWLGLSNCQKRNTWFWSDGTKVDYTSWNSGEPNWSKNECCVHFNWSNQKNWNDIPCHEAYSFICVKKAGAR